MAELEEQEEKLLSQRIARVLDETRSSNAVHNRKLKDLSALRSASPLRFFSAFVTALKPLFEFQRRSSSAERVVRFVAVFAACRNGKSGVDEEFEAFLEEFLLLLIAGSSAANKTARFRSCQIISEIILRLPDDAEVSDELWDEVIESMKARVEDKVPAIRSFAVRSLARFANDAENSDMVDSFLQALPLEQNAEVRKAIILLLPPSNSTLSTIIDCTLDVNESVRRAAYCVLANRFPLQSLTIKQRTVILQRGLADRSASVQKECFKLMKDEWLVKSCNGDPVVLLKFLDVETYETVGTAVMESLLRAGMVNVQEDQSIQQFLPSATTNSEGEDIPCVKLMEAEVALYWRTVCRHLEAEARIRGSDAAATTGTEAAVYAAEASNKNDLLERVLPSTVSDYVELLKAHLAAGLDCRFTARQLLLLGAMLDFSDTTNRKTASVFVLELLRRPLEVEVDQEGNKVIIGDGTSLGGDRDWASAVSKLAKKIHVSSGEFEQVVVGVVEELARPCRERTCRFHAVDALPCCNWAKHAHLDVQRVAMRCLGLFGLLDRKPNEELVKQLKLSFANAPSLVGVVACKALIDLVMWHGPQEVERAMVHDLSSPTREDKMNLTTISSGDSNGNSSTELMDLLCAGLDRNYSEYTLETDDHESVQSVLGEGFAKILLLSQSYPNISASLHSSLLAKLLTLYFSNGIDELCRLKQSLSVFFEHYPALSADHKKCVSKAFIPVLRSMWPGIYGNAGGAPVLVSNLRKRAVQASRFLLQMMQAPLYSKDTKTHDSGKTPEGSPEICGQTLPEFDCGEEGLAILIAVEVVSFPEKKTAAAKAYLSALSKIVVLLCFRASEQEAIKCMRGLLNRMVETMSTDKEVVKELRRMADRLKSLDEFPDQELSQDKANLIFGKPCMPIIIKIVVDYIISTRQKGGYNWIRILILVVLQWQFQKHLHHDQPDQQDPGEDQSERMSHQTMKMRSIHPASFAPAPPSAVITRSQRASKTAALNKMTANRMAIDEEDEDGDSNDNKSGMMSQDESDDFAE
ncbi:hypothetical protein Syun_021925 [Stephania yunnanensis]|uniref:Nuclear condensin complex subunit 3 C-terminal domain-containing protein n=1 Tax=Stephania yunnanensis TaxID=152371 RepID=A0AAP0IHH8_9MAGN